MSLLSKIQSFKYRIQQQYPQGEHRFIGTTETSGNITARVIERDTSSDIHYILEDSRGFRTRQHGRQSHQNGRQNDANLALSPRFRHYKDRIHLGQDMGLAYCNVLSSVLSVVISVSAPQRHSVFLGLCKDLSSWSAASERVLCDVSDSITALCRLRGSRVRLLWRRIGSSSSRKPCRFFPQPDDAFPPSMPGVSRYTPQAPREHLVVG
ncbi:hypothetical protein TNCV_1748161 [Trichonephila clavipes]|nr:hypothetical protein TNCV_1748161 [Trichonephila clavipes]